MIERKVNTPLTSSLGRLFDAVAALVLSRREVDYDAQAAIELEGIAENEPDKSDPEAYALQLAAGDWSKREPATINTAPMLKEIVRDVLNGENRSRIAARFHSAVAVGFVRASVLARAEAGIKQVVLSGGCLHNRRLARLLRTGLEAEGFQVFQHRNVSPGDGGLSYGQAVVASAILAAQHANAGDAE
jgi:hydrogenase maturation protein HypF